MDNKKDILFLPVFVGATLGVVLEVIATLVDEIIVGNIFNDEAFAAVNLIEPYTVFEVFIAYLVTVAGAALIVRTHGAGDHKKMGLKNYLCENIHSTSDKNVHENECFCG